jgi:PEP-CTERM/exosortase A-associated glycosyltransferase
MALPAKTTSEELRPRVSGSRGGTRILHVLDHSLPQQSGYSSRSHAILKALSQMSLHVEAITSPKHGSCAFDEEQIESIRYLRTVIGGDSAAGGVRDQLRTILRTRRRIAHYVRTFDAALIHAHSPCLNGLAGLAQARPLVYEMRSSWEDAAVSSGTTTEGSVRYRLSRALETGVIRRAQAVTVICGGLKKELIGRGIADSKITIVPNALPSEMFEQCDTTRSAALRQQFDLMDKRVVGFFGSFFEWEGLDRLVQAMPKIVASMPDVRVLLVGGGRQEDHLRRLVSSLGLHHLVRFVGQVGPDAIRDFYGVADLMVYPRNSERLTEMVTPLKPLEAMAQETPVIASDVGGHRELIENGKTGFLYPAGDAEALAAKILEVLNTGSMIEHVTRAARQYVERERRWSVVCENYVQVYERLLGRPVANSVVSGT